MNTTAGSRILTLKTTLSSPTPFLLDPQKRGKSPFWVDERVFIAEADFYSYLLLSAKCRIKSTYLVRDTEVAWVSFDPLPSYNPPLYSTLAHRQATTVHFRGEIRAQKT
jgi:hypothetical protein